MTKIPFVKTKIGPAIMVWLENSNTYLQLEEPAWYVFSKITRGYKTDTIATKFASKYNVDLNKCQIFISEIRNRLTEVNKHDFSEKVNDRNFENPNQYVYFPESIHSYKLGNQIIEFQYGSRWLERYIHPLISHLETSEITTIKKVFELFSFGENVVFRLENEVKGSWTKDESHVVKGKIFMELTNIMHNKVETDWLMTVHASAITNGLKTILFSAAPGSGKTTIAALLQANGYHLISDDFVPVDQISFKAFPFPIAMSVKKGSMEMLTTHYPDLKNAELNYITDEKVVKYIPIKNEKMKMIFPVREFMFIKYDSSVDFICEKLTPVDGIKRLLEETWICPTKENVTSFFKQITTKSFYQLTYSNNQKALKAIKQLFEND